MNGSNITVVPRGAQWSLEAMGTVYVAVAVLFVVNPDWVILVVNEAFARYDWPMVFFPTERFWFSLGASVPATRAFLAFNAARKPANARFCVKVLQVSLVVTGALFAWQFFFRKHAALYALGCLAEFMQVFFYQALSREIP